MGYDAVVVGASIAGCTTATFLGRRGASVALLERSPREDAYKMICTHAIQPSARGTLRRLGLVERIEAAGGVRSHPSLWSRRGWIHPSTPTGADELPYGYNLRRERLDPMIRSLAASTGGVDYVPGAAVTGLISDAGGRPSGVRARVDDREHEFRAPLVIGADGRDSTIAELARLPVKVKPNARFAYFAHYEGLEFGGRAATGWLLEPDAAAVFRNDAGISVVTCVPHRDRLPEFRADLDAAFTRFIAGLPDGPDLSTGRRVTPIMGRLDMSNIRRRAAAPGLALVGDAALTSDPLWGVGCGWALQGGEWLAQELAGSLGSEQQIDRALHRYRKKHRRALAAHHWMICDFATGRRLNPVERLLFAAAALDEEVARSMFRLGSRLEKPQRVITPRLIAHAGRVSLRARG